MHKGCVPEKYKFNNKTPHCSSDCLDRSIKDYLELADKMHKKRAREAAAQEKKKRKAISKSKERPTAEAPVPANQREAPAASKERPSTESPAPLPSKRPPAETAPSKCPYCTWPVDLVNDPKCPCCGITFHKKCCPKENKLGPQRHCSNDCWKISCQKRKEDQDDKKRQVANNNTKGRKCQHQNCVRMDPTTHPCMVCRERLVHSICSGGAPWCVATKIEGHYCSQICFLKYI